VQHMKGKQEVHDQEQKSELQSRSQSVWNLQPHVRLIHMKEQKSLDNKILVEEEQQVSCPIKDNQLGEQVQEVTINYLHYAEAVV
jgi:hypothetical protein